MISLGQRVAEYKVEAWDEATKGWRPVSQGTTIGYRKLDRFPKVRASKVRLTIVKTLACPTIKSFGVHLDTVSAPESFEPAKAKAEYQRTARPRN
jgi:alpha-L-fucosidase